MDGGAAGWRAGLEGIAGGFDEAGDLVGGFAAVAEEHEEGADLFRGSLAAEDHGEGVAGFVTGEGAGTAGAAAEGADVRGEAVLGLGVGHGVKMRIRVGDAS